MGVERCAVALQRGDLPLVGIATQQCAGEQAVGDVGVQHRLTTPTVATNPANKNVITFTLLPPSARGRADHAGVEDLRPRHSQHIKVAAEGYDRVCHRVDADRLDRRGAGSPRHAARRQDFVLTIDNRRPCCRGAATRTARAATTVPVRQRTHPVPLGSSMPSMDVSLARKRALR
jgi:hypothetical protein